MVSRLKNVLLCRAELLISWSRAKGGKIWIRRASFSACFAVCGSICFPLLMVACGFTPVYRNAPMVLPTDFLASIEMPQNQVDRQLGWALRDRLKSNADGRYRLTLDLHEQRFDRMINATGAPTRYALVYQLSLRLSDLSGHLVHEETISFSTEFARNENAMVNTASQNQSRERAASHFAEQLVRRLGQIAETVAGPVPGIIPETMPETMPETGSGAIPETGATTPDKVPAP